MELTDSSGLFEAQHIPSDWLLKELAEISDIDAGLSKPKIIFGKGYLVVTVQDLYAGETIESSSLKRVVLTEEEVQRYRLFDGDILIGNASVKRSGIGYSNRFVGFEELVIFAKYAYRVKNLRFITSQYLHYALRLDKTRQWIISNSQTGTLTNLNKAAAKSIPITFPGNINEQKSITTALSDLDALLDSLDRLIAKKRNLKQAAMQQLLTGQTRLPGFSGEWENKSIQEIALVGRGRVISHTEISKSPIPTYPVYSSQTSDDGIMGYLSTYDFEGEYVTWTTDGANAGTVFARTGRFNCTNVCGTIKLNKSDHRFITAALGRVSKSHVSRHLGNPKLMNDVVKKIEIRIPKTIKEQNAIAEVLTNMDSDLAAMEQQRNKTAALKQGMMQELLTGRTRLV